MSLNLTGAVTVTSRDKITGEIVDQFGPDTNRVVDEGIAAFWERASTQNLNENLILEPILYVGDDFGNPASWSVFNPEPAQPGFTAVDQNVIHTFSTVTYSQPSDALLRMVCTIDGQAYFDANDPTGLTFDFNSLTLRFISGVVFSYKRLPVRTLSREVDLTIQWDFLILNKDEYCA